MVIGSRKGRSTRVPLSALRRMCSSDLAEMSLTSTAKHFVGRLSADDKNKLHSTLQALDGKCIRLGSTCSGTDVVVPVFVQTFKVLCEMFDAPWLMISIHGDFGCKSRGSTTKCR